MRFSGKTALVTGGGGGLGRVISSMLAEEGANVVVTDIDADGAEETTDLIRQKGGTAKWGALDVSDDESWKSLLSSMPDIRPNLLVNNAGISGAGADPLSLSTWDRLMAVNARGVFLGMSHIIPGMQKNGGGAIVNISSIAAFGGMPGGHMGYYGSKAAVHLITQAAAVQFASDRIRINSVHPGVLPAMRGGTENPNRAKAATIVPLGRLGDLREVGHAVLFLASDDASYITGTSLLVDGGLLAKG